MKMDLHIRQLRRATEKVLIKMDILLKNFDHPDSWRHKHEIHYEIKELQDETIKILEILHRIENVTKLDDDF